jgi:hypothetical protein
MEPHPVPQNILDVEFKLFGSFTLKQFLKMLMGSLAALLIFFLDINPLIKWPLIATAILIGIAMAVVQNFGVWLAGFVKAIFVSPRYVWVKESRSPEILQPKEQKAIANDKKISQSTNANKYDLSQISLERMFAAREGRGQLGEEDPRDKNIERIIKQVMPEQEQKITNVEAGLGSQPAWPADRESANSKHETRNTKHSEDASAIEKDKNYYVQEINRLKLELKNLVRDQKYKDKETEIMHQINDLYHEMKDLYPNSQVDSKVEESKPQKISNFQGQMQNGGQIVFGIVVDSKNNPIEDADVFFDLKGSSDDVNVTTDSKGQFNSIKKILPGKYDITVTHPELKFHTYTIDVGEQKLPAYKLRAR